MTTALVIAAVLSRRVSHAESRRDARRVSLPVEVIPIVAGVGASIAAAVAAWTSRAAVERANLAFVWAELSFAPGPTSVGDPSVDPALLRVQLHSDGPGIALDVRWSLGEPAADPGRRAHRKTEEETARWATDAVRALRPGESWPSVACATKNRAATSAAYADSSRHVDRDQPFWVLVRWTDSAGRRWEFGESSMGRKLANTPRVVRRRRGPPRNPWWARLLPSWRVYTEPPRIKKRRARLW